MNINLIIIPGDSVFYPINKNVIKYKVKEIIVFNNKLDYLIKLEASDYWKAKVSSEWPSEFTIIPEAIGRWFILLQKKLIKIAKKEEEL